MHHVPPPRAGEGARPSHALGWQGSFMRSALSRMTLPYDIGRELTEMAMMLHPFGCLRDEAVAAVLQSRPPGRASASRRTPVVLIHGYGGNRFHWSALRRRLLHAGFSDVHSLSYSPLAGHVRDIARALVLDCHESMWRAGSPTVHVIGHSLGGIVLRYAIQRQALEPHVATAITVATPHQGTRAAQFGLGGAAAVPRP
jgi:triacylglycerol esterase/lipase EstA (alpha/beta hydrolase family)